MFLLMCLLMCLQAQLHDALGQRTAAAHYYARNLQRIDAEGLTGSDLVEALQYLAQHCKVRRVACAVCV